MPGAKPRPRISSHYYLIPRIKGDGSGDPNPSIRRRKKNQSEHHVSKWCGMNFPSLAAPSRPSGRCLPPFRLQIHPQRRQAGVAPSNNESATAAPATTKSKNEMHSCGRGADRGRLLLHREEAVSLLEEIAVARVLVVRREPGDVRGRTGARPRAER